mgnify:CR=1 FL=1
MKCGVVEVGGVVGVCCVGCGVVFVLFWWVEVLVRDVCRGRR